jgi:hypothetical protein
MVWYGRVWDDAAGDWAHELDDAPTRAWPGPTLLPSRGASPPPCERKIDGHHSFRVVYSGRFVCTRCGFEYESTYQHVGNVVAADGHVVLNPGNGLVAEAGQ